MQKKKKKACLRGLGKQTSDSSCLDYTCNLEKAFISLFFFFLVSPLILETKLVHTSKFYFIIQLNNFFEIALESKIIMNIIHIKYLKEALAMCSDGYDFWKIWNKQQQKGLSMNINTFSLFYDSIRVRTIAGRFHNKYIELRLRYELRSHYVYVPGIYSFDL